MSMKKERMMGNMAAAAEQDMKKAIGKKGERCCQNCEHYLNEGTPVCRRYPPAVVYYSCIEGCYEQEIKHEWVFARTSPLSWCGEWRRSIRGER
jgi:hypothetical protein